MQNYIIVFQVPVMAVAIPLAGLDVNLDVSAHYPAVGGKDGIFEVTAAGVTGPAWENYMKPFACIRDRVPYQVALPQAGNEPFRDLYLHILTTRLRVIISKNINGLQSLLTLNNKEDDKSIYFSILDT